jgi:type IV pilus assembly protein PilM
LGPPWARKKSGFSTKDRPTRGVKRVLFTKPKKAIGIDIGNHSVKAVQMSRVGNQLCVDEAAYAVVDRNMYNNDTVGALSSAMRLVLENMNVPAALLVGALPGQTVVVRYRQLDDAPPDQLAVIIQREAGQNIPYDLSEVFLDSTIIDEVQEGDKKQLKMLMVAAKHEVITSRIQVAEASEVQFGILSIDSLSLADAADVCHMLRRDESIAMVNIGYSSTNIHFIKDGVSNFIRDVSWGARELTQAIVKDRRCSPEEADTLLKTAGVREDMAPSGEMAPGSPAAGDHASLLDPLDDELGGLDTPQAAVSLALTTESRDLTDVLHVALGRMVAEIRRSFDYYEHQLYEQPVTRLILSGGCAHVPIVGETLMEELDVETVEVANPLAGTLQMADEYATGPMRERPAQFMVALGLAARGMAEL